MDIEPCSNLYLLRTQRNLTIGAANQEGYQVILSTAATPNMLMDNPNVEWDFIERYKDAGQDPGTRSSSQEPGTKTEVR